MIDKSKLTEADKALLLKTLDNMRGSLVHTIAALELQSAHDMIMSIGPSFLCYNHSENKFGSARFATAVELIPAATKRRGIGNQAGQYANAMLRGRALELEIAGLKESIKYFEEGLE